MKILLIQNSIYVPTLGGANKASRMFLEGLAARGHTCRAIAPAGAVHAPRTRADLLDNLTARGFDVTAADAEAVVFQHGGVEVHAVVDSARLRAYAARQLRVFEPDWSLVPSEDPAQVLLTEALNGTPGRVVYLAYTTLNLPFGPACFLANPATTDLLRRVAGIITSSRHLTNYIAQWGGLDSVTIQPPVYGDGPFPHLGAFDRGYVTMINPCAVKGLPIFLELARRMPDVPFAAVPTWGTTPADRAALAGLPNIRILPPSDQIDDILRQTRVLVMPSLWDEAFGFAAVEAMLRGVPVLASNTGGLPEAKLGVDYVLPVRPITRYQGRLDDQWVPVPVIPEQDVTLWLAALQRLLTDQAHYTRLAADSRAAALAFVGSLSSAPFETFLEQLQPAAYTDATPTASEPPRATRPGLDHLSPARRALLARRLGDKVTR